MDSELANDRTFLAWLRTGISLFGLGFVVAKIALIVQPDTTRLENKDLYSTVGVLIVLSGVALVVVGYLQHAHTRDRGEDFGELAAASGDCAAVEEPAQAEPLTCVPTVVVTRERDFGERLARARSRQSARAGPRSHPA